MTSEEKILQRDLERRVLEDAKSFNKGIHPNSLERYALRKGKGLELRNRRPDKKRGLLV